VVPAQVEGPPLPDPAEPKDEALVVREVEALITAMGPVCYLSTVCGKFLRRNGVSVQVVCSCKPLEFIKRHPEHFVLCGAGHVALRKDENLPEVIACRQPEITSRSHNVAKAMEDARLPPPEVVTEETVVEEFVRLLEQQDGDGAMYISALCGRFMQRFKQPVTKYITGKPADLVKRHLDIFVLVGSGYVGLRKVLGDNPSVETPGSKQESAGSAAGAQSDPRVAEGAKPPPLEAAERTQRPGAGSAKSGSSGAYPWLAERSQPAQSAKRDDEGLQDSAQVVNGDHSELDPTAAANALMKQLVDVLRQSSFLKVSSVEIGGALGQGLTVGRAPVQAWSCNADVVVFVEKLPATTQKLWLPHLMQTLHVALQASEAIAPHLGLNCVKDDHIVLDYAAPVKVQVRVFVAPSLTEFELREAIRITPPPDRHFFLPAFVRERNDLFEAQPDHVKIAISEVLCWAKQQTWSSAFRTPSDYLLSLIVLHAALLLPEMRPDEIVSQSMELFRQFDSLKVLWSDDTQIRRYDLKDIWRPLLYQAPLVIDPVNPYFNVADQTSFDAKDLVGLARSS
jgi:hypothetical protein